MTVQLPATHVEAEAIAYARQFIANCREGDFLGLGIAPLHPKSGDAFLRQMLKQYALWHPFNMDNIVMCAEEGWDAAGYALRELIAEYTHRREELPPALAAYNIRLINPSSSQPNKPRGQKASSNILQDLVIVTLIMELVERFPPLRPTRSQLGHKRHHSACSIVAFVMAEAGLHRGTETAIMKIWERYSPSVLPGTVAEALLLR